METNTIKPVVIIAGGSRGIGAACVEEFLSAGWTVISMSRSPGKITNPQLIEIPADMMKREDVKAGVRQVIERWGRIDAVVHSVGDIFPPKPTAEISWERWRRCFDICLGTAVHLIGETYEPVARTSGAFVLISSVAARRVLPGTADYCAAKAALNSLTRSLAFDLARYKARANSISPADVDTDMLRKGPFSKEEAVSFHKLGRIGKPREVAKLVLFLASEAGAWITGSDFVMDGGLLL